MKAKIAFWAIIATFLLLISITGYSTTAKNRVIEKLVTDITGYKIGNNPPQIYLLYPSPNAKVGCTTELIWFAIDPDKDKLVFNIYIGETQEGMQFVGKTTKNVFKINLDPGKEYFWMIEVFDGKEYMRSPVRSFMTERETQQEPSYNWTYILYMNGDNNLYSYALSELNEIKNSSLKDMAVIILCDGNEENDTWLYVIDNGIEKTAMGEKNMGSSRTLEDLLIYAKENYVARDYILEIWGHGNGWMGVCFDATNTDMLTMAEIENALAAAGGVDIVIFSACYMGCVEVAYSLKNVADYMIACEGAMPAAGLPHDEILRAIGELGAEGVCKKIVDVYGENVFLSTAFAAWNLSKMSLLVATINEFIYLYAANVTEARNESAYCLQYIDLKNFAEYIGCEEIIESINETIISSCGMLSGAGIYFPVKGQCSKYYPDIEFSSASLWDEFISNYV